MPIRVVEDLVAPGVVTGIDLLTLEMAPDYNEIADYVMTGVGYIGGILGFGSTTMQNFLLRMGAASLPLTARALRERIKSPVGQRVGTSRLAFRTSSRPVTRYPAPATETPFEGVRLV